MCLVQQHALAEREFGLAFRLKLHRTIIQSVELIAVLINGPFFLRGLLENVLLRVKEDVEVGEVEALIDQLLYFLLSLRVKFTAIDPFLAKVRVVVDL